MMTLAELQIKVDASQAKDAASNLGALTAAGAKAEVSAERLAAAQVRLAKEARALLNVGLGLGRQVSDLGVQFAGAAASGDPLKGVLMALVQQGPQIGDAFAVAKGQGLGFSQAMKGLYGQVAPFLPLLAAVGAAVGVAGGAFYVWKRQADEAKASLAAVTKATADLATGQLAATEALLKASDFAAKYKVENTGLAASIDKVLVAQNANYAETLRSIDANDAAGHAAAQRAEQERLLTVALLRSSAAEATKRADELGKKRPTFGPALSGFLAAYGTGDLSVGSQAQDKRYKELGGPQIDQAIKANRDLAAALNAQGDAMQKATLTIAPAKKAREALNVADKAGAKAAREAAAAEKEFEEQIKSLTETLSTPAEKAMRETVAQTAFLRKAFEEEKIPLEQYIDLFERLHPVVVEAKDAQKAFAGELDNTAADLAREATQLDKAGVSVQDLTNRVYDLADAFNSVARGIKSGDISGLLAGLSRGGAALGASAGLTANLGALAAIAALSEAINPVIAKAIGLDKRQQKNAGRFGLLPALLIGKASNKGAGFDLTTGQVSGKSRDADTEDAARGTGQAIIAIQDALKAAGIGLTDSVKGLVIGTRDATQIYLASGKTLLSAVGDSGAAVDTALRAILESATYVSEAQKKLVDSALAAGKGFDAIQDILSKYESAQGISAGLADEILRLKSVSAGTADYDLAQVRKGIDEQRKAASALATEGYLTAEQLAGINAQLEILQGLQIDEVMKRYAVAVDTVTSAVNDNVSAAAEAKANAEDVLREAYQREADAINARADQFRALASSLRTFEESLRPNLGAQGGYNVARAAFLRTRDLAATGDVKALGSLQGVSEAYLAAARSVAPDARAYARDLAAVRNAVQSSATAAEAQVTQAEAQLAALHEQVGALIQIDATLATVAEAITGLSNAAFSLAVEQGRATQTPEERAGGVAPPPAPATPAVASDSRTAAAIERQNELLAEQNRLLTDIAKSGGTTANVLQRSTRDGEGFVIAA